MSDDYHVINFPLQKDSPAQEIEFIPFGTRTLKIKVTNPDPAKNDGKYVLRGTHVPAGFPDDKFFSHEKGGTNFRVSWGGGQETGACLNGVDKKLVGIKIPIQECKELEEAGYLYLNVTHVSGPIDKTYTLELGIYPTRNDKDSNPLFTLDVMLKPPKQVAAGEITDPIRLERLPGREFIFKGSDIPEYIDRWWSSPVVEFKKDLKDVPELKLVANDKDVLEIQIKDGNKFKTIAFVHDHVRFQGVIDNARYFDAELYHFHEHTYVLRLWFAWLEKHTSTRFTDEFPDAERFDLVIDGKKRWFVVYAATDYHWREVWSPVPRPKPRRELKAHLGLFSREVLQLLNDDNIDQNTESWLKKATEVIKAAELLEAQSGSTAPRIPSKYVRKAVIDKITAGDLGANVEAHVPSFENVEWTEGVNFVSSNPTRG